MEYASGLVQGVDVLLRGGSAGCLNPIPSGKGIEDDPGPPLIIIALLVIEELISPELYPYSDAQR